MGFLDSVQHGIEKASQEAARLAKIQHLHSIITDLTYKSNHESQSLVGKALELFQGQQLTQAELTPFAQQIVAYSQQIAEVQAEIQKVEAEHISADGAPLTPAPTAPIPTPTPVATTPPPTAG